MKDLGPQNADRVEAFVSTIDRFEPTLMAEHGDTFRLFARFISRSIDGRFLERHPADELVPNIERLMAATFNRPGDQLTVHLDMGTEPNGRRGVLFLCLRDQRFIYSVAKLGLDYLGVKTFRSINGMVPVVRDAAGNISSVNSTDAVREAFLWVEVEADHLGQRRQEIEDYMRGRLHGSQTVVDDFAKLTGVVQSVADRFATLGESSGLVPAKQAYSDSARLLRWLLNEHFVFLGTRFTPRPGYTPAEPMGDFGIGRLEDWRGIKVEGHDQALLADSVYTHTPYLRLHKSHTESWVYRTGRTDHVVVQVFDAAGEPAGSLLIEGMFSFPGLAEPRTSVPLLDRLIDQLYIQLGAAKGSHRYRTMRNAFNSLPLEYLFALPLTDVRKLVEQVLEVDAEHRSQIHITTDAQEKIAFVFVALPRSHYSDELRADIRRLLKERFRASSVDEGVYAGNSEQITFHYFLTDANPLEASVEAALRNEIDQVASPWAERLDDALEARFGTVEARQLHSLYHEAFPNRYREETSIARAVEDIGVLQTIDAQNRFDCDIYQEKADALLDVTRLRMFEADSLLLSDILPILDNFGLVVIDQFPTTVHVAGRSEQTVATFRISGVKDLKIDLSARRNRLRNAIRAVVVGAMSSDPLNQLLLRADIAWPSVVLIAAYNTYARQLGLPYGQPTVQEILLRHADIVRSLTELFRAKFDPELEGHDGVHVDDRRLQLIERTRRALLVQLEGVDDLTSDQVLRTLYNLVEATVRTNFYSRNLSKEYHLVLKFDPQLITRMPEPRPYREILVFHPQVAGLHLRGGPAARGGIRWSDRLLDFRTEVLGLMATQNLKNVLIVPRGAKGAFVLRQPPMDMAARRAHADAMYQIFIGGLLDVTDNLVEGKPVTPKNVLCYDKPDHYLVVAADKGTAHLSDTANRLALERHFWLGDAFASGGSKGYDHKKEAITSRGAWACVRRHFREMGINPESDPVRVVGIGDMSGDVFGNGLLRSRSLQLIAAFDHRNFFIDPQPDPATSFAARQQLFALPRSSWEDYPKSAISPGGGIYPRGAKNIALSEAARTALGISGSAPISGPELATAIIRAPVDLMWNGGIGTYIKASTETHLDVGDPANDAVRIDATEFRAKVIGEGGNLGITAAGRVELASRGVFLNTDAVDNSAGVDMSDHEVNLKILFQRAKETGGLTDVERDQLMENVREEVGHRVVGNNWLQSRMISLDALRSKRDMSRFVRAMAFLADRTPFRKRDANLPGERLARQRAQRGEGLYRPELAFLAANAKLDMRQELGRLQDDFPLEGIGEHLVSYFPDSLVQRFRDDIWHHPLAINIARTILGNWVIGDAGCSWLPETTLMTGRSTAEILKAYFSAATLLGAPALKRSIDSFEAQVDTATEYRLRLRIEDALEEITTWLLRRGPVDTQIFRNNFTAALGVVPKVVNIVDDLGEPLRKAGVGAAQLEAYTALIRIDEVLDVALLASETGDSVERAAGALYCVGEGSSLLAILRNAEQSSSTDDLDRPARFALRGQLRANLLDLSGRLLRAEADLQHLSGKTKGSLDSLQKDLLPLQATEQPLCNLVMASERVSRRAPSLF
jgi:glutamate dehydrogenase